MSKLAEIMLSRSEGKWSRKVKMSSGVSGMRWVSRFDDERSIVCLWLRIGESLTELLNGEALNELYPVIISGGSIVRGELGVTGVAEELRE